MDQMRTLGLAAGLALLSFGTAASAADDVGKWYLAPMVYDVRTGTDRNVDDGAAFQLSVGKNFTDQWSAELALNHGSYKAKSSADKLTINALSLDALRHFYRDSPIHPYVLVGYVQSGESSDNTGHYDRQMIQGGLGVAAGGNINPEGTSMFEPIGGSAPKYTGKNVINPLAAINAGAMMMDTIGETKMAKAIDDAVTAALASGRIKSMSAGKMGLSTTETGDFVASLVK